MNYVNKATKKVYLYTLALSISLIMLLMNNTCLAQTIVIKPNTVISASKSYDNVTLDMTYGSFIIKNNATLTISNSTVVGTLSSINQNLFVLDNGNVHFASNKFKVNPSNIPQHPNTQSLYYAIRVGQGSVYIDNNHFSTDYPFTIGLLITSSSIATKDFQITNNIVENFHGAFYLIATDNALISGNTLIKDTFGNIVFIGTNSKIINNKIFFSGNNHLGNGMDIFDSENITVTGNQLYTPTCHGIYVLNSHKITIDENVIFGGITYGMNILSYPEVPSSEKYLKVISSLYNMKKLTSENITISNNLMSQNRYGIAATDVDLLKVKDNFFVQRFTDSASRKFWTDNSILLKNVTNLTWTGNLYKEAFSQEASGDNSNSFKLVTFPVTGGVSL